MTDQSIISTYTDEDLSCIASLIQMETHRFRSEGDVGTIAHHKASLAVADMLGITHDELRKLTGAWLSKKRKAAKERREKDMEYAVDLSLKSLTPESTRPKKPFKKVPKMSIISEDPFETLSISDELTKQYKALKPGCVSQQVFETPADARTARRLIGRVSRKLRWSGYITKIVGSTLYVKRSKDE